MIKNKRKKRLYFEIKTPDGLSYFACASCSMNKSERTNVQKVVIELIKKKMTTRTGENVDELSFHSISFWHFKKVKHTTRFTKV